MKKGLLQKGINKALLLIALSVCCITAKAQQTADTATITSAEAKDHIDQPVKLKGKVVSIYLSDKSSGKPTFFNLDASYPKNLVNIIIYEDALAKMNLDLVNIKGKTVLFRGTLKQKEGKPYMVLQKNGQLEIVGE